MFSAIKRCVCAMGTSNKQCMKWTLKKALFPVLYEMNSLCALNLCLFCRGLEENCSWESTTCS